MMNKKLKFILILIVIAIIFFYGLPLMALTGYLDFSTGFYKLIFLLVFPICLLILNMLISNNYGFIWYYPLMFGILFIPSVFIYYEIETLLYSLLYIFISYIGQCIGNAFYKKNCG